MVSNKIKKIFSTIAKQGFDIRGPRKEDSEVMVAQLLSPEKADYSGKTPNDTYKNIFFPAKQNLYSFKNGKISTGDDVFSKKAIWCMNILDLKAVALYDIVFSNDAYYQKIRKNILIVGFSPSSPQSYEDYKTFAFDLEENILEHLMFDIFIVKGKDNKDSFFAGSHKGMEILETSVVWDYEFVQFVGFIPEEGPDKRMLLNKEIMESLYDSTLWDELGKICLACGKCSIHCPTCFCYDLEYENTAHENKRNRVMGNCFYDEFAQVAGGHTFLPEIKDKIKFWYMHKFLRIPHEYKFPGCIGCGRCFVTCPVGINIFKNISRLQREFGRKKSKDK